MPDYWVWKVFVEKFSSMDVIGDWCNDKSLTILLNNSEAEIILVAES